MVCTPFSVDVANDEDDLTRYFTDFRKATNPYDARYSGPLVAGAVLCGLLGARWLAGAMVVVALFLASRVGRGWRAREQAHRVQATARPFRITFDVDRMHMEAEEVRSSVDWSGVVNMIDGEHTLIIRLRSSVAWYVPRGLLTEQQAAFIGERAASRP